MINLQTKDKLPKDIVKGRGYSVEFWVSADMAERFIDLVGDYSSLHTNRAFARRSMYRENVIHGMLPITFISALRLCYTREYKWSFYKISARFLKPIFVNDRLLISSKISQIDEEKNQVELEYALKKLDTGTLLTTGNFTLKYSNSVTDKDQMHQSEPLGSNHCTVTNSLVEQDLQFEQISKGDEKSFQFLISENHAHALYGILTEGLLPDYKLGLSQWFANCNTTNLLSTCLFSTFVGMCIPGKYATFMDFNVIFHKSIQRGKKYLFTGKVGFKSQSTFTLVENASIHDPEDKLELYAIGKINAKVNQPPSKMPSVEFLKANAADLQLKDKVVLITGASRGIGETTAKLFSLHGAKVVINYFQGEEDANRIVKEIVGNGGNAIAIGADVSDRQQVKEMLSAACEKYGTVHILVNNAVRDAYPASFMELTWDDFQKAIDVVVKGAFNCCQEVLPLMLENKAGKIINISTVFTDNPPPNQAKYVVSKSGLVGLTRSLAVEFAPHNIQVNMVVPSIVETDLSKHVSKMFLEEMKNATPMKRNATAVDVAKAVIFLSSALAPFTTGQKIMVTGGNPPLL